MLILILKVIVYYILIGTTITLGCYNKILTIIEIMKISDSDGILSEISEKALRKEVVIMFILLCPFF